jgi:hypothetical protein
MTTNPDELVERAKAELYTYQRCSRGVCEEMTDRITSLQARIAQLEEAGEAMADLIRSLLPTEGVDDDRDERLSNWRAAQESKS